MTGLALSSTRKTSVSFPPMKAGDFCSNWTGNSQVPPIGLDAWANVLHTEGLHIHKQLRILAASQTLGLFSESGCTQRSPTMSILSISSASTLDQQHQFPEKQHPQKRKIWLYWLRRSKFYHRNQPKERESFFKNGWSESRTHWCAKPVEVTKSMDRRI